MRAIIFSFIFLLISGCATNNPTIGKRMWDEQLATCKRNFDEDSRLAPIRDKVSIGSQPTLAEQSQTDFANDLERPALLALDEIYLNCSRGSVDVLTKHNSNPAYINITQTTGAAFSDALLKLYQREITYGQFAQIRTKIRATYNQRWVDVQSAEYAEHQASAQAAEQARVVNQMTNRELIEYGGRLMQGPTQVPPVAPRTTTTNCKRYGETMSCTTQ